MIICTKCEKPCETKEVDTGYGRQEYFGAIVTHSCIEELSVCCEWDVEEVEESDEELG